jgi:hypothetical protein
MMRRAALLLLLAGCAWAEGPQFGGYDKNTALEFENVYNDLRNPQIANGRAANFTATSLAVSTATLISSATITNATITNLIVTALSKVGNGYIGRIGAVGQANTTSNTSSNGTSFTDGSLTVTTPTPQSSSSQWVVMAAANGIDNTGANTTFVTLARNGTNLFGSTGFANTIPAGTNQNPANVSIVHLDVAGSATAITYSIQIRTSNSASNARSNAQGNTQTIVYFEILP